jgi:predicted nuclease with TOPRIM domain
MTDLNTKITELNERLEETLNAHGEACREKARLEKLAMDLDAEIKQFQIELENQQTDEPTVQATVDNFHEVLSDDAYRFYRYNLKINLSEKYSYRLSCSDLNEEHFQKCMGELVRVGLIANDKFTELGLRIKAHLNS